MTKRSLYYVTAFFSGMAVMAVEMSATRLLSPYFGSSLYVWTNVIGLVMLALALGYFFGGKLADKRPEPKPYFSLVLFTAIWILLIPFISKLVFAYILDVFPNLSLMMVGGSFIAVLFLFVVPMVFLGMIVPYTVKMVTPRLNELGRDAGQVSALSTVGSIIGTFLPAFVLIPVFGTTKTFILIGVTLFFLAAIGLKKWWFYILAALSIGLFWLVPPVFATHQMIYAKDSPYQFIFVTEDETGRRKLHIDSPFGLQSDYRPDTPLVKGYYSFYSVLPAMIEDPQKILILGHAGGTFTRIFNAYYPDIEITGVEIDPKITEVAYEYFGLEDSKVTIVHGDARTFLLTSKDEYDLIIVDAYHLFSIPSHLATQSFFKLVQSHLSDDGLLAMNVLSWEGDFIDAISNTVVSVFSDVIKVNIPSHLNSILLARNGGDFDIPLVDPDLEEYRSYILSSQKKIEFDPNGLVFSDDHSSKIDLMSQQMILELFSAI